MENCLNYTSLYLRKTQPWLTGEDGAREETELAREGMEQLINDNAASLELSAAQVRLSLAFPKLCSDTVLDDDERSPGL